MNAAVGMNSNEYGAALPNFESTMSAISVGGTDQHVENRPLSPVSERYRLKMFYLQQKYDYLYMSNNRIRNRLYHVKKEINHLKRLKRVLCQRLIAFRDPFMDSCLEIPDNEPPPLSVEKTSNDAAGKVSGSSKKRKAADAKRVNKSIQQAHEVSSMAEMAKNSVISIIDSVITESHEERVRANSQKIPKQSSATVHNTHKAKRNEKRSRKTSERGESEIDRIIRVTSGERFVPVDPETERNKVLSGFGENLEENFMAED